MPESPNKDPEAPITPERVALRVPAVVKRSEGAIKGSFADFYDPLNPEVKAKLESTTIKQDGVDVTLKDFAYYWIYTTLCELAEREKLENGRFMAKIPAVVQQAIFALTNYSFEQIKKGLAPTGAEVTMRAVRDTIRDILSVKGK